MAVSEKGKRGNSRELEKAIKFQQEEGFEDHQFYCPVWGVSNFSKKGCILRQMEKSNVAYKRCENCELGKVIQETYPDADKVKSVHI